jgi:hypothetical protein
MGFALRTSGFAPKPLAVCLILQQLAGETPEYLLLSITAASPDWRSVASLAVDAVSSQHSKRAYQKAIEGFRGLVLGRTPADI